MVAIARPRHVLIAALVIIGCYSLLSSISSTTSNRSPSEPYPEVIGPELPDSSPPNHHTYDFPEIDMLPGIPSTTIPGGAHSYGYTIFENLYLRNGTLYIVTADPSHFPSLDALLAVPLDRGTEFDLTVNESVRLKLYCATRG